MTLSALLDGLLFPRPNGSAGLAKAAAFIEASLEQGHAPEVARHTFTATPHAFELVFAANLVLMLGFAAAMLGRRPGLALLLVLGTPALLIAEMEWLWSPVGGLFTVFEDNIVATFPGAAAGPTLLFTAHYDTTTHFGDHQTWSVWMPLLVLAIALAVALAWTDWRRSGKGNGLPRGLVVSASLLLLAPAAAHAWFFTLGPHLRHPSPGALDNGGSVATLILLAERLGERPAAGPTTVEVVFLAAEEERALGSWSYAGTLDPRAPLAVINLEQVGVDEPLAYVGGDGFLFRYYRSPREVVDLVQDAARDLEGRELPAVSMPPGTYTDARSFLAHGIPALTLMPVSGMPRQMHSARDTRDRLDAGAIGRALDLVAAIVARVDRDPGVLDGATGS